MTEVMQQIINKFPESWFKYKSIDVGDGWAKILIELFTSLEPIVKYEDFKILQIKEKFGCLRIYTSMDGNRIIGDLISKAEDESGRTCEICGEPGEENCDGWIKTVCKKHWKREDR